MLSLSLVIALSRYHSLSLSRSLTLLSHTRSLSEAVHELAGPRLLEECLKVKADPVLGAYISFIFNTVVWYSPHKCVYQGHFVHLRCLVCVSENAFYMRE